MIGMNLIRDGLEPEEILILFRDGVAVVRPPSTLIGFLGEVDQEFFVRHVDVVQLAERSDVPDLDFAITGLVLADLARGEADPLAGLHLGTSVGSSSRRAPSLRGLVRSMGGGTRSRAPVREELTMADGRPRGLPGRTAGRFPSPACCTRARETSRTW